MSIWKRNVGTPENPVSYLHEYAVALIWDRLNYGKCYVKTASGEHEQVNVPEGGRIAIPDELTAIGGMLPDIAIYNAEHRPVAVIEVQVSAAPSDRKIARMENLGVKMFVVPVPNQNALRDILKPVETRGSLPPDEIPCAYYGHTALLNKRAERLSAEARSSRISRATYLGTHNANQSVIALITSLRMCDPALRQELRSVLDSLDSVESIHPILPGNPKAQSLQRFQGPNGRLKVIK